jgi:DMSO/TMAO reductase YedYZ heme-binding membrane subunit
MISLWYASRAAGLLALVLLTGTVVLGALTGGRASSATWPRFTVAALHRNLSLLTLTFVAAHVVTAVIDGYAGIAWLDTVLPFVSVYHPFWLGLGAAAFDLLLALVATSLLRTRMNPRVWRAVHWAAYACWPVALVHGFGIGAGDTQSGWGLAVVIACLAAVAAAVLWRVSTTDPDTQARRRSPESAWSGR